MAFIKNRAEADAWQAEHKGDTPRVGEAAPDFELSDINGKSRIRLSDFASRKPVALIFGSFT